MGAGEDDGGAESVLVVVRLVVEEVMRLVLKLMMRMVIMLNDWF